MTRREELEALSELEINKIMAKLATKPSKLSNGVFWGVEGHAPPMTTYNWCKKPADIMPLAIESGVNLFYEYRHKKWDAWRREFKVRDVSPYRALAIVLILIKESEL